MSGFTDSLILIAPVRWWPSLASLAQYPLNPTRSFCAAVTGSEAPHQHSARSEDVPPSHGLSRLGTSTFLTAQWRDSDELDGGSCVEVVNPFTGECLTLWVAQYPPEEEDGASLFDLAVAHRIRLRPQCLSDCVDMAKKARTRSSSTTTTTTTTAAAAATNTTDPSPALAADVITAFRLLTERHCHALVTECLAFLQRLPRGVAAGCQRVHAALVSGDTGSGKRSFLEAACGRLPASIVVADVTYVVEHRCLDFRELLTQDEREAVHTIKATLQPIPHGRCPATGATSAAAAVVVPIVVVRLYYVDLLWQKASGNALTDVAACQLCASVDALTCAQSSTVFLLWSTATQPSLLSSPLRHRLAAQHLTLAPPTAEERRTCLERKLQAVVPAAARDDGAQWAQQLETLVDQTAHLSAWRLAQYSPPPLEGRETAPDEHPARISAATTTTTAGAAYEHLFNVDAQIASLEELVVWPLTHRRLLRSYNVPCTKGVLVCGPSGSGKTALLSALARRLCSCRDSRGIHVMMVDGLSLIEKEVGRSEKNIARLFADARAQAPTALFLDNLDALAPPRGRETSETTTATDRTLSTLLTEMDGVGGDPNRVVVVVASAPGPLFLDAAVRRPGRLDVHLKLTCPPADVRADAVRQRLGAFLRRLLAAYHLDDADGRERIGELEEEVLTPFVADAAQKVSTAAETVALAREAMLSVLTALAPHTEPGGGVDRPDWALVKAALHRGLMKAQ